METSFTENQNNVKLCGCVTHDGLHGADHLFPLKVRIDHFVIECIFNHCRNLINKLILC